MVFTMNTSVFAVEVGDDAGEEFTVESAVDAVEVNDEAAEVDSVDEIGAEDVVVDADTTASTNSANAVAISADVALSDNAADIESNLNSITVNTNGDYFITFPTAVAFGGKDKPGSKNFKLEDVVHVFKAKEGATVSDGDLISWNEAKGEDEYNTTSFNELTVKKVSVKAAKGATVDIDGSPLYEAKKATYIKGIKLEKKDENSAFQKVMKDAFKKAKKSTELVSANGLVDGKLPSTALFSIAVYPCYVGNDADAIKVANDIGLEVGEVDFAKTKWDKSKVAIVNADGKKKTLKLTKAGKYKGLAGKESCTADTNSFKATEYFIADGDYAGNIYKEK